MKNIALGLLIFVLSWMAMAQDERYFRKIFSGDLASENKDPPKKYSYLIHSPYYSLDLNHDGLPEQIVFVKKDNEDWIEIFDKTMVKVFSYRFENMGYDSELFKIELRTLSEKTSILILYYYEGVSKYINFQGTSRIYAVTIDNNDLKTLSGFKGASFFDEVKTFRGHYHKRNYEVYLEDLNHDKVKELVIRFHRMSTVFLYKGEGKWQTYLQ